MRVQLNILEQMKISGIKDFKELSQRTGITVDTLQKHAEGKALGVRNKTLERLCYVFNCNISDLLKLITPR